VSRLGPRLVIAIGMLGACRQEFRWRGGGSGNLEVRWSGTEKGMISGTATAEWCGIRKVLEIRTVQGDTGLALALYPTDTIRAGAYRVVDPPKAESLPPSTGVALRWLTQNAIRGFQGESGAVVLERSPAGLLSGRVTAAVRSVTDTMRLMLNGTFRDLSMRPQARGCAAPEAADSESQEDADSNSPGDMD
jgi:hypothetical protein